MAKEDNVVVYATPSLPLVVFIVFLILKLVGVIGWSWWWVTCPLWAGLAVGLAVFVTFMVVWVAMVLLVWLSLVIAEAVQKSRRKKGAAQ